MLNEELLMENTEIWQKKLLYTNLEEKAHFLNRKVSIILCLATIILSFLPLVFYNDRFMNIIQLFMVENITSHSEAFLGMIAYTYMIALCGYTLYCHFRYKYSYYLVFLPVLCGMAELLIHVSLISSITGNAISSLPMIICLIISIFRMILGFLASINYASGEAFYIKLLKRRTK